MILFIYQSLNSSLGFSNPAENIPKDLPSGSVLESFGLNMFWDSNKTNYDPKTNSLKLSGEVVFIGDGNIVSADRVMLHLDKKLLVATGHVVVLTESNIFYGEKLNLQWISGDFEITEAIFRSHDKKIIAKTTNELLGFTSKELEFEENRKKLLLELSLLKGNLQKDYGELDDGLVEAKNQLVEKYAALLEREDIIKRQPNPYLRKMPKEILSRKKKRREFWQKSRTNKKNKIISTAYFKIEGKEIKRISGNDFRASEALWTPCYCEDDESPAWGFRTNSLKARIGGYVSMEDPILEIKGIPVFYLPFLKLPIKHKRQSGFLAPSIATSSDRKRTGFIYSQPIFFNIADNFDTTFTTNIYQNRGTRYGLNLRYALTKSSGWEANIDLIRDRLWLEDIAVRKKIRKKIAEYCQSPIGQSTEDCLLNLDARMGLPENTWRSSKSWRGLVFLTPRFSLVSHGKLLSDQRYDEDFSLFNQGEANFTQKTTEFVPIFSTSKGQVHLDGKDFYLGLSSKWGNDYGKDKTLQGLQLPLTFKAQTRTIPLTENFSLLPNIFINGDLEHRSIEHIKGNPVVSSTSTTPAGLSSGFWQRGAINVDTPIYTSGIAQIFHRGEIETRRIYHSGLTGISNNLESTNESSISSLRNEISINIPIDGKSELPNFLQPDDWWQVFGGKRYVHHFMDFELGFTSRPYVSHTGPYLDRDNLGQLINGTYFETDSETSKFDNESNMIVHNKIKFQIRNRWKLFRETWKPSKSLDDISDKTPKAFLGKARNELKYQSGKGSLSRDLRFDEDGNIRWPNLSYVKSTYDYQEPLIYNLSIKYDFEKERLRNLERLNPESSKTSEYLPSPWEGPESDLKFNYAGYTLSNYIHFDLESKTAKEISFSLGLPEIFQTTLGFTYSIIKSFDIEQKKWTIQEHDRIASAQTTLIPNVTTSFTFSNTDTEKGTGYRTNLSVDYVDRSQCWGLNFNRKKDSIVTGEEDASYTLTLFILFMNNRHVFDNIFKPVERDFLKQDET